VAQIFGICGACRGIELTNITVDNIEKHGELLLVKLPNTKTKIDRAFVVREEFVRIVLKYQALRPDNLQTNRFFINYQRGRCLRQNIGRNKISNMPNKIAEFLNLPNPELYSGHCFRRTSATLLADSGADFITVKRHGGWKSNTVAEGYIEDSVQNKSKIRLVQVLPKTYLYL
jgi:integrase